MSVPHISVVIPVYQAEECIDELYRRLKLNLEPITPDFEIVLIEDFSRDLSWQKILALSDSDSRVKGFRLSRNFGQHYAITAGMDICSGDWVIVMDCDLQDPPEAIPDLYKKAEEGYDIVLALRVRRKDSLQKRFTSWMFYKVFNLLAGTNHNGQAANFRIMNRKVVLSFRKFRERLRFFGGITNLMGFKTGEVGVQHAERYAGKSSYSMARLLRFATDVILAYSNRPLYTVAALGFVISTCSFALGLGLLLNYLILDVHVTGWTSLITAIFFTSGLIIFTLGILGVYLAKVFDEVKRRPLYLIQETTLPPSQIISEYGAVGQNLVQ